MNRILIAGATGYIGSHLVKETKRQEYFVRALVRDPEKLQRIDAQVDEIWQAEITKPASLICCCENIDTVISSVGITRQKDGVSYMEVDYQGNLNLLREAVNSGVRRFIYVFIFNADKMRGLKIIQAKQKFVEELKGSSLSYCLINPTGFFSDMHEFLDMAKKGKVYLFGRGACKMNPVDGADLAEVCVRAINSQEKEIDVGGPEVLTHTQIAKTAFEVLQKPARIAYIPIWVKNLILYLLRRVTSVRVYGPVEFLMTVLTQDMVAPSYGSRVLKRYFESSRDGSAPF